jgi:hypothetical protein
MTRISNYIDVMHELGQIETLTPDGDYERVLVENPRLTSDDPKMLRVSVPRKGWTFTVIRKVNKMGLMVGDVWQYDRHKEEDRIMLKIVPPEDEQQEVQTASAAL